MHYWNHYRPDQQCYANIACRADSCANYDLADVYAAIHQWTPTTTSLDVFTDVYDTPVVTPSQSIAVARWMYYHHGNNLGHLPNQFYYFTDYQC